jgi:quinoprotein glucose dehydrogenase
LGTQDNNPLKMREKLPPRPCKNTLSTKKQGRFLETRIVLSAPAAFRLGAMRKAILVLAWVAVSFGQRHAPQADQRDWPAYGGGPEQIHYSRLDQINSANVSALETAWSYDTGDAFEGSEMQCNPIVIGGVLYATSPKLRVIALDAARGTLRWSFDPFEGHAPGKIRNRGLSYWSDGTDRRVFVTARNFLYALDATTGKVIPGFGSNGRVDLREGLGRDPQSILITPTSPGLVYKDLLILGGATGEDLPAAPGDIRAFDVRTGRIRWSFHTIPHPGEAGYKTWPRDAWKYSGSANNWAGMALDEKRGLVFVPTGSAAFDFYGANRLGDNLFANTLLALSADTGARVWHFQAVRHDVWDRDFPAPPSLVTVNRDGRMVDAVAQITKTGHVYVFERATGKPLFPIKYSPTSKSNVDGEVLARTQPLPLKPPPFARQILTEMMLTKRTPEAHRAVVEQFRRLRSEGQWTPPSFEGTIIFPGFDGGAEWGGAAFDPETRLLYVNANEMAWILRLVKRAAPTAHTTSHSLYTQNCANCHREDRKGSPPQFPSLIDIGSRRKESEIEALIRNGGARMPPFRRLGEPAVKALTRFLTANEDREVVQNVPPSVFYLKYTTDGYNKFLDPDGYPAVEPPWGTLTAIDLDKGEIAWSIPFGEFPELAARGLRNTGTENYGGAVVTAGGLLFIGATNHDRKFHAYDKRTGKLLWEARLPSAGNATPATYEADGRQYVVIAAGGGKSGAPSGGQYVAFASPTARSQTGPAIPSSKAHLNYLLSLIRESVETLGRYSSAHFAR